MGRGFLDKKVQDQTANKSRALTLGGAVMEHKTKELKVRDDSRRGKTAPSEGLRAWTT